MIFKVEVATNNAAFHEDAMPGEESLRTELADVLRRLRIKVTQEAYPTQRGEDDPFVLFDGNGGRVGTAWFEEE